MPTLRQIEANRRNSLASTGPRTEAGKLRSRANSLDHSLAAETLSLPEDEALIVARIAAYTEEFDPRTEAEHRLIEQAANDSVRVERCFLHETALLVDQSKRAQLSWDRDRDRDAERLALKLPKRPSLIAGELEATPHGCNYKIRRWQWLHAIVQDGNAWDDDQRAEALDLLGVPEIFRSVRPPIDPEPGSGRSLIEVQSEVAVRELTRLVETRQGGVLNYDEFLREQTAHGLAFPSREVWLVRRYEMRCNRRLDLALKHLRETREARGDAPIRRPTSAVTPAPARVEGPATAPAPTPTPAPVRPEFVTNVEHAMEALRARAEEPSLTPIGSITAAMPETVVQTVTEPSVEPEPEPAPKLKGNRRYRRQMAHRARKRQTANSV